MDRPFVVISNDGGNLHLVGLNLQQTIRTVTFRWFKQNIVCEEHPEFCETGLEAEMNQMRINWIICVTSTSKLKNFGNGKFNFLSDAEKKNDNCIEEVLNKFALEAILGQKDQI